MPNAHYKNELPKKYNPQNTSREVLKETFSIRLKEYDKIWADIKKAKMEKPEEHYIVQGVRGSGKTTLLTRLTYAIEDDKKLSKKLIAVQLKEEEYGISNLFSLWLRIAEDLEEHFEVAQFFKGLVDDIEALEYEEGVEEKAAFKLINKRLKDSNKKIILLVDNIVELFDNFSDNEKAILREVLSQNNNVRIIGGSAIALESFYDHKDPFYQFFKVVTLNKLTKTETIKLLKTLGKVAGEEELKKINAVIKNEPEKIESIRRLTGGIPRTIVLLFEILAEGPKGTTFQILDETLDMASPIYKHRMDDLTRQQKPIIHAIAQHWDAISAKEIAKKTRLTSKNISAQLAQLQRQWIVESIKTGTKNNLYRLQERFFNIWYLMRYGRRQDKQKMQWLTQFLEVWCSPEELKDRAKQFSQELSQDAYLPGTLHYAKALMACAPLGVEEREAIYGHAKGFFNKNGSNDLIKDLPEVDGRDYLIESNKHCEKGYFDKSIECLETAIRKGEYNAYFNLGNLYYKELKDFAKAEAMYQQAIKKGIDDAYLNLGILYHIELKDFARAEAKYQQAIEKGNDIACLNLGVLYADDLKDFTKAEAKYQQAIKKGIDDAYFNLGNLYHKELKDFANAEALYQQAIEKGNDKAYNNLGILYHEELKDFAKAEALYQQAIEKGNDKAYLNLGNLYADELKDFAKAEAMYQQAIEKGNDKAYNNLGNLYAYDLKDFAKAGAMYQQAIEKGIDDAYLNLGNLYKNDLKDFAKAEATYQEAIEKGIDKAYLNLGNLYANELKDFAKAEALYQQAIEKGGDDAYLNLGYLYQYDLKDFAKAEALYQQAIEKGIDKAYINLGNLYADDLKDFAKAEAMYQQAIEKGNDKAYFNLGNLYADDIKDFAKAEALYQQAIEKGIDRAYLNLGNLYADDLKDFAKAEAVFQQAIKKGVDNSLNALAWMYFSSKQKKKKKVALEVAYKSIKANEEFEALHTFISIALWNAELVEAEKQIHRLIKMDVWKKSEPHQKGLIELFLLLLAKGQTNLVDNLLKEYDLSDQLKLLYYTLMHLMKDKYPDEYLRMGSEMQETVDEMLAEIEQLKKDYK